MNAWLDWIYEIALSRVDTIERELYAHPEHSPKFSEAVRELHAALDETEEHPNAALTGRDEIWMGYTAALALEMYLAGTRDGGRIYHAFITGELPAIRKREEEQHEQTDVWRTGGPAETLSQRQPYKADPHGRSVLPGSEVWDDGHGHARG